MTQRDLLNNALESLGSPCHAEPSLDDRGSFFVVTRSGERLFKGTFQQLYQLALGAGQRHILAQGESSLANGSPQPEATGPAP